MAGGGAIMSELHTHDAIRRYAVYLHNMLPRMVDYHSRVSPFGEEMQKLDPFLKSDCSTPALDQYFGLDTELTLKHPFYLIQAVAEGESMFDFVFVYRVCELGRPNLPGIERFWGSYNQARKWDVCRP